MLAMRSVINSTTFKYDSIYLTRNNTLNSESTYIDNLIKSNNISDDKLNTDSSIGDLIYKQNLSPQVFDAKFKIFNTIEAKEWMIIFYIDNKDIVGNYNGLRGWIWKETLTTKLKLATSINTLNTNYNIEMITNNKTKNGNYLLPMEFYNVDNRTIFPTRTLDTNISYGLNLKNKVRWGIYNDEKTNSTKLAISGVGLEDRSAGCYLTDNLFYPDFKNIDMVNLSNALESTLVEIPKKFMSRSYAFEWFIR